MRRLSATPPISRLAPISTAIQSAKPVNGSAPFTRVAAMPSTPPFCWPDPSDALIPATPPVPAAPEPFDVDDPLVPPDVPALVPPDVPEPLPADPKTVTTD